MVNQYINEGASLTLGNTITSCMGSADSSAARTTCSTTEAKALLVQKLAHAACSRYDYVHVVTSRFSDSCVFYIVLHARSVTLSDFQVAVFVFDSGCSHSRDAYSTVWPLMINHFAGIKASQV